MGFTLVHNDKSQSDKRVNFWNWRPTVELIASFGIIDDERLEQMQIEFYGAEVTPEEAHQIADRIEQSILSTMPSDARLRLDLSTTTEPDDFQVHGGEEWRKNYSATHSWLTDFVAFCRSSGGFSVL